MLVLLVIFMVTAPLLHQGVEVQLPKSVAQNLPKTPEDPLILSITKSGNYYLNETPSREVAAQGPPAAHPLAPPRQGRLPQGRPEPPVRRRGRNDGHAQPARRREPRNGDGAPERGRRDRDDAVTARAAARPAPPPSRRSSRGARAPGSRRASSRPASRSSRTRAFLALVLLTGKPRHVAGRVPISLPVRVVSPAALGRPAGGAGARPRRRAGRAGARAKAKPVIEKPTEKIEPSAKAMPEPKKPAKPEKPKPARRAAKGAAPAVELPSAAGRRERQHRGRGRLLRSDVTGLRRRLPVRVLRPAAPLPHRRELVPAGRAEGTICTVSFRIQRSGQVADVKVESGSGVSYYDRAAASAPSSPRTRFRRCRPTTGTSRSASIWVPVKGTHRSLVKDRVSSHSPRPQSSLLASLAARLRRCRPCLAPGAEARADDVRRHAALEHRPHAHRHRRARGGRSRSR